MMTGDSCHLIYILNSRWIHFFVFCYFVSLIVQNGITKILKIWWIKCLHLPTRISSSPGQWIKSILLSYLKCVLFYVHNAGNCVCPIGCCIISSLIKQNKRSESSCKFFWTFGWISIFVSFTFRGPELQTWNLIGYLCWKGHGKWCDSKCFITKQ